jgi:hypothetical protein
MMNTDETDHDVVKGPPVASESFECLETEESSASDIEEAENVPNDSSSSIAAEETPTLQPPKTPWYCSVKFSIGLLLLGFIVFVIVDTVTNGYVRDTVESFLDWIEQNPVGGLFLFVVGRCRLRKLFALLSFVLSHAIVFLA